MTIQEFAEFDQQSSTLFCKGEWTLSNITKIKKTLKSKIKLITHHTITINGKSITKLDSAGVWMLLNGIKRLRKKDITINYVNFSERHEKIFSLTKDKEISREDIPQTDKLTVIEKLGKYSLFIASETYSYVSFIGELFFASLKTIKHPRQWRWNTITSVVNKSGAEALPIIALLSFSIGVVISYLMGNELREYGADIFIVNLLGLSVLREFGPLVTAIIVGGRTGSAFTAQLGIMKINQEIDAIRTMGITPIQFLLLPRLIGLLIVVPLLTIWADIFGLIGGIMMAQYMLGISWIDFLNRFQEVIPLRSLIIGLAKAPVFALIVASVGCFEGIKVHGSAESVGERTTRSVVMAIFLIIIFDGICSILLSKYKL